MRRLFGCLVVTMLCLLLATSQAAAKQTGPSGYKLVAKRPGTATLVSPGYNGSATAVQLTSTGKSGWGAIGFSVPSGLTLSGVNYLATEYEFTLGSCWGGSPRFTVGLSSGGSVHEIYFYMGPPPSYIGCPSGVWTDTGNLASATGVVDDANLPGGSQADPYANALARYGADRVAYIAIDFDSGWAGSQTALFDDTKVDGALYTYEP